MVTILSRGRWVKPSGAETGIYPENTVSTMAADAKPACHQVISSYVVLSVHFELVLAFHKKDYITLSVFKIDKICKWIDMHVFS